MNTKPTAISIYLIAALLHFSSHSAYLVQGKIEGAICSGIVIKSCAHKEILAFENGDGNKYQMPESFDQVSESKNGRCWINRSGGSITSSIARALQGLTFYTKEGEALKKVSPDYLVFKCIGK